MTQNEPQPQIYACTLIINWLKICTVYENQYSVIKHINIAIAHIKCVYIIFYFIIFSYTPIQ